MSNAENGNLSPNAEKKLLPEGLLKNSPRTRLSAERHRKEESARRRSAVRRKVAANYEATEEEQGSVIAAMFDREIDAGIFFDNEKTRIDQVIEACRAGNMKVVRVKDSCMSSVKTIDNQAPANIIDKSTNLYYKLHVAGRAAHLFYDKVSGVQQAEIDILHTWEKETRKAENRFAFFDWDRTLTMVEGIVMPGIIDIPRAKLLSTSPKVIEEVKKIRKANESFLNLYEYYGVSAPNMTEDRIYEDMCLYLAGGAERLALMRKMFAFLRSKHIKVVIITNNGACVAPSQAQFYKKLVHTFIGYTNVQLLCTKNTYNPNKPLVDISDKGYAISKVKEYKKACTGQESSYGGGKTKKNRRRN
jgi:hypothetical protein